MARYTSDIKADRAYSVPDNLYQTQETNPLSTRHTSATLVDVTNAADDTYYYTFDMDDYRKVGLQIAIDGGSGTVTVTLEGSLQDDGTAAGSITDWRDVTYDVFNVTNTTTSTEWIDDAEKLAVYKYCRLKAVFATGGADDGDLTVYIKQLY